MSAGESECSNIDLCVLVSTAELDHERQTGAHAWERETTNEVDEVKAPKRVRMAGKRRPKPGHYPPGDTH